MNRDHVLDRGSAIVPFLLGGLVGIALGVLFAPRPGSETRRRLLVLANADTGTIGNIYRDAAAALRTAVADGRRAYLEERERLKLLQGPEQQLADPSRTGPGA